MVPPYVYSSKIFLPLMILQQFQDAQNNVIGVAKARSLGLLCMMLNIIMVKYFNKDIFKN